MDGCRVLVTGGAGFIGSALVAQLAAKGARVVVVDNLVNGKRENIAGHSGDSVQLEVADIRDRPRMAALLQGVDILYHLAVLGVRHALHDPAENHSVNATATLDLLLAARAQGVGRFVYVSSSEVYGTAKEVPMTEDHPTFPHTVYGGSKLAGECYARAMFDTHGFPTVVVRPFNAYGPRCHHEGDSGEVIPKFMLRCLAGEPMVIFGDGEQTRDFTYVADVARGILLAGLADAAVGRTLNLGAGREISIKDLAGVVARTVGGEPQVVHDIPRPGDVRRLYCDASRAQALLDFAPEVPLENGLAQLRDWYAAGDRTPEELLADEHVRNWEATAGG